MKSPKSHRLATLLIVLQGLNLTAASSEPGGVTALNLPRNLKLVEKEPQVYDLTVVYENADLYGKGSGGTHITATYTRGLPDGEVRWNNVRFARKDAQSAAVPDGEVQAYLEGFAYRPPGQMFEPSFFSEFPPTAMETRVLLWDMLSVEVWAWEHFDQLQLNRPYRPSPKGESYQLPGVGAFSDKQALTWLGNSERNNEPCALIYVESYFNPFEIKAGPMSFKGRTHYWAHIWVSLEDKQIEHAILHEDGITEIKQADQTEPLRVNVLRTITVEKRTN